MKGSIARFAAAALLILSAAIFLRAHSGAEILPTRTPLRWFPQQIGMWTGTDVAIDPDSLKVLGAGDFLSRFYRATDEQTPSLDLFIAYFPSQRTGDTIHSPKNCLPGAGWSPVQNSQITINVAGHSPFTANRYVIAKGDSRDFVLYWYWAHDRGVASEYWARYYLVKDSLRMNRSDGSLVRVVTSLSPGETLEAAQNRILPFVTDIVPLLQNYIPR